MKPEKKISKKSSFDAVEYNHPAFGQIAARRGGGRMGDLYGSDFKSKTTITVEVSGSVLQRGLSNDWYFSREQKIEVEMTESQWATFISSLNVGNGVPCTLRRFNGETMPDIESYVEKVELFKQEHDATIEGTLESIKALNAQIQGLKISQKQKDELLSRTLKIKYGIDENLHFVKNQFSEHVENTVEAAKQEVHGYMNAALVNAGIEHINGNNSLQVGLLPHKGD